MEAPDKIYIHEASAPELAEPVLKEYHIEYIRKDALLEWAKEMLHKVEGKANDGDVFAQGMHAGFGATISKLTNL